MEVAVEVERVAVTVRCLCDSRKVRSEGEAHNEFPWTKIDRL